MTELYKKNSRDKGWTQERQKSVRRNAREIAGNFKKEAKEKKQVEKKQKEGRKTRRMKVKEERKENYTKTK
jgi:hypothetical protein